MVSATPSGSSAKAFSRSAETGTPDWPAARRGESRGGGERLVAGDRPVEPPQRGRETAARRGQGGETQPGEEFRGAHVPRVRQQQYLRALVQRAEQLGLLGLGGHDDGFPCVHGAAFMVPACWVRMLVSEARPCRFRWCPL